VLAVTIEFWAAEVKHRAEEDDARRPEREALARPQQ